ncbi:trafficking regulator of GLUT4 1 isoform X3 [Mirounga angustirostris]|uniref:trafficking regulator of GLUT4 1 isoform X3 n=1 Tax=Mirounga angustirostris TaxID=9716 RepID=UPI00313BBB7D
MANPLQPQFPSAQEPGTALPLDLPEMEMLLTKVEGKDDKPLKLSKSLSRALDLEQNGHGLPFKVVSEGRQDATLPWSASRASSRRASSIATASSAQDQEVPKDYLILAIASCFCPVWPLNLIPLIFSIMFIPVESYSMWSFGTSSKLHLAFTSQGPEPKKGVVRFPFWWSR